MSYFYVLTYIDRKAEHWFRTSALEIIDCIQDFMIDNDDEELSFTIALHELDKEESIALDDKLSYVKYKRARITAAKIIDAEYESKCLKKLPEHIYVCEACWIFTERHNCTKCNGKTTNTDI